MRMEKGKKKKNYYNPRVARASAWLVVFGI
jgi:hypothetical protein